MNSQKINILILLFISGILVLSKYIIAYCLNFDEDLFFKIFRLGYEDFESYALITESLSNLSLKTNFSNSIISEKIIGFPFFSIIWHSIFFKFFSYYSFVILEVLFYFLIIFLLFKIFNLIQDNRLVSIFSIILLLFTIELLIFLSEININFSSTNIFYKILLPLNEFYGQRFPHPLVTSVYFFSFIYIAAKAIKTNDTIIKRKYVYLLGICSIFLINSFFFHFFKASIFILILFIFRFKLKFFRVLRENLFSLTIYIFLLLVGFSILFLQLHFAEDDYLARLGMYNINIKDKIFILKIILKKLFQFEILLIIFFSFLAKYNYKNLKINEREVIYYDLLFAFFISSLISPYIFVILTNKFTHLYYFWSAIKFSGFLFLFAVIIKIFYNLKLNFNTKVLSINLTLIMFLLNFYNNYSNQKNSDNVLINDRSEIQSFLNQEKYKITDKSLFSEDYAIMHLWLKFNNKYLMRTEGFVTSYSDELIEDMIFNYFKIINISQFTFLNMLIENENTQNKRNNFAATFNYKYSVNSLKHKKPIEYEYTPNVQKRIKNLSPLVQWHLFISNTEKRRLLKKYKNYKINKALMPDIIILKKSSGDINIKESLKRFNYNEIFSNTSFSIHEKDLK